MGQLGWNIVRDLNFFLVIIFMIEQLPGNELLHDTFRKVMIAIMVAVLMWRLFGGLFFESSPAGGPRVGGPLRQKKTEGGKSESLEWAVCEMQGWRAAMEDATCVVESLPEPLADQALFAVFDGHGGSQVSHIASKEFPKVLQVCANKLQDGDSTEAEKEEPNTELLPGELSPCTPGSSSSSKPKAEDGKEDDKSTNGVEADIALKAAGGLCGKALSMSMIAMDAFLRQLGNSVNSKRNGLPLSSPLGMMARHLEANSQRNAFNLIGSTAIVALVDTGLKRSVTVANCGDSRAVLCRNGKAIELSEDHKPELASEEQRIRLAGGSVKLIGPCHRIDGWGLNLSRALGDFHYKARGDLSAEEQKVIAVPEIRTVQLHDDDEFLVLACDGCFELHTSQNVVDIVSVALRAGFDVKQAAEQLVDQSCSPNLVKTRGKGGDNCSAIIIKFR
ncbi:Probable protein phosphatase CG10417 [Durusdinium trenchii]|uniref:protein-serine/threonine phosphatase n=2 Tax=Durusdinium trenchii TaxID=1381693 RepID=A0ABP0HMJ2_9DINO